MPVQRTSLVCVVYCTVDQCALRLLAASPWLTRTLAGRVQMVGFRLYAVASVAAVAASVSWAIQTRKQFYPAAIFMTTAKVNVLVRARGLLVCVLIRCGL